MSICTEFCSQLRAIKLEDGVLLSHDELVEQLQFTDDDLEQGRHLGTWQELQQRTLCAFCQLVVIATSDSVGANQSAAIRPDQAIGVLIFPGEQSFRLSYPSRLGIRLAFLAEGGTFASGPDSARLVRGPRVPVSRIQSWLQACDQKHEACSPEEVKDRSVRCVGPNLFVHRNIDGQTGH